MSVLNIRSVLGPLAAKLPLSLDLVLSLVQTCLFEVLLIRGVRPVLNILGTLRFLITVLKILLSLLKMRGRSKFYLYSGNRREIWEFKYNPEWIKYFRISSFVRVMFYSDMYYSLKFSGVCVNKSNKGIGTNFKLKDRLGLCQMFYFFSPTLRSILIVRLLYFF